MVYIEDRKYFLQKIMRIIFSIAIFNSQLPSNAQKLTCGLSLTMSDRVILLLLLQFSVFFLCFNLIWVTPSFQSFFSFSFSFSFSLTFGLFFLSLLLIILLFFLTLSFCLISSLCKWEMGSFHRIVFFSFELDENIVCWQRTV